MRSSPPACTSAAATRGCAARGGRAVKPSGPAPGHARFGPGGHRPPPCPPPRDGLTPTPRDDFARALEESGALSEEARKTGGALPGGVSFPPEFAAALADAMRTESARQEEEMEVHRARAREQLAALRRGGGSEDVGPAAGSAPASAGGPGRGGSGAGALAPPPPPPRTPLDPGADRRNALADGTVSMEEDLILESLEAARRDAEAWADAERRAGARAEAARGQIRRLAFLLEKVRKDAAYAAAMEKAMRIRRETGCEVDP